MIKKLFYLFTPNSFIIGEFEVTFKTYRRPEEDIPNNGKFDQFPGLSASSKITVSWYFPHKDLRILFLRLKVRLKRALLEDCKLFSFFFFGKSFETWLKYLESIIFDIYYFICLIFDCLIKFFE